MVFPDFLVKNDPNLQTLLTKAINTVVEAHIIGVELTESHAVNWKLAQSAGLRRNSNLQVCKAGDSKLDRGYG